MSWPSSAARPASRCASHWRRARSRWSAPRPACGSPPVSSWSHLMRSWTCPGSVVVSRTMRETAILGWRVFFTRRAIPRPKAAEPPLLALGDLDGWLDDHDVLDGTPFLIDPRGHYDSTLRWSFRNWQKRGCGPSGAVGSA